MDASASSVWTGLFPIEGRGWVWGLVIFLSLQCFIEVPVFNANNADADQLPRQGHFFHVLAFGDSIHLMDFLPVLTKGNNCNDFLFAFLHTNPFLKIGPL